MKPTNIIKVDGSYLCNHCENSYKSLNELEKHQKT